MSDSFLKLRVSGILNTVSINTSGGVTSKVLPSTTGRIKLEILDHKISVSDIKAMAETLFGNLVKAVVDVHREIMVVDAELHSDEESLLLEQGSRQEDLWGINLYPEFDKNSEDFIEFDSMINLRPSQNNRSRGVDDQAVRDKIIAVVHRWII